MSYSQFERFNPVPAAPVKSSLNTVVMPGGAPGTAASALMTNVAEAPTATNTAAAANNLRPLSRRLAFMGRAFPRGNGSGDGAPESAL
jgi:hypothetical protein